MTLLSRTFKEAATSLAIVAASNEPLLFLAGDMTIIAASDSFSRVFQIDPNDVAGRKLSELGTGEWRMPKLASLLKATASGAAKITAYEIDLNRKGHEGRHLVVNARRLVDGDAESVRLLVAIADVTEVRAQLALKDKLMREKAVLLQEVQHRVANSLQIIASVLMQGARKVSLGLIVTELVINALKHAYPEHGRGKIVVGYRSGGSEWRLWVKDDGVGMSFNHPKAKAGLGSGIVDALAKQLQARVEVSDAAPGAAITIYGVNALAKKATIAPV
jgi:anti-sigma regulatory factor (Ser/Thr protein kinase)